MSAAERLNRIVTMVAELSREECQDGVALHELAARYCTTPNQIRADVRALTLLGEHPDADWLSSLSVWQEEDRVFVSSMGPYRRPLRLLPEELVALRIALATEDGGAALARRFGAPDEGEPLAVAGPRVDDDVHLLLRRAAAASRRVRIRYAAADRATTDRVIEPHELLYWEGKLYCLAWCARTAAWRHFRADRVIEAVLTGEPFTRRPDLPGPAPDGPPAFRPPEEGVDRVRVRFAPRIARWLMERHPDAERRPDGSVIVTYDAASVDWLVRHVLQYGPEAEVVEPAGYREAMRQAVA